MENQTALTIIASSFQALLNCQKTNNMEWLARHRETIDAVCAEVMPHGSGIDGENIALDYKRSKPERLVFINVNFHHMDENGFYDGWTHHEAVVTPSLVHTFRVKITGSDRDQIKDYLYDLIAQALDERLYCQPYNHDRPYIALRYIGYAIEMFANKFRSYDRQS